MCIRDRITNVMNDQYCYQTSKKIRQVFDYKRRNGQYIGSFAPVSYTHLYIGAWVDWNGNGSFDEAGEFIGYLPKDVYKRQIYYFPCCT